MVNVYDEWFVICQNWCFSYYCHDCHFTDVDKYVGNFFVTGLLSILLHARLGRICANRLQQ